MAYRVKQKSNYGSAKKGSSVHVTRQGKGKGKTASMILHLKGSVGGLHRAIEDPKWAKWAEKKTRENLKNMPEMRPLQERLLEVGGDWVALQPEPDLDKILKRGQLFVGQVVLQKMENSRCHSNCAHLWDSKSKEYKIVTGWALSDDGIWRQHTWLLKGKAIVETTSTREKYYGFVFTDEEANQFCWANM